MLLTRCAPTNVVLMSQAMPTFCAHNFMGKMKIVHCHIGQKEGKGTGRAVLPCMLCTSSKCYESLFEQNLNALHSITIHKCNT